MSAIDSMYYFYCAPKQLDLDLKNRVTSLAEPSIKETPILELKALQPHPCYIFFEDNKTLLVIIVVYLVD